MSARLSAALDAYHRQSDAVVQWFAGLDDAEYAEPSVLPGWDVRAMLAHLVRVRRGLEDVFGTKSTLAALPLARYVRIMAGAADEISAGTLALAGEHSTAELLAALREPVPAPSEVTDRTVLAGPRGPITALDWVNSRTLDLVVHADDLARSLPGREPIPLVRPALAVAVRTLAEILAAQAPGRSVEVRIPPFVAVQAVAGPRHTRGTPANVVEADPVSWVRLATGRADFTTETAGGRVRATGPRSDLSALFPLLS